MKYLNQLGMSGYSVSARIIRRGIQVTKNSKAVSSKDSRDNRENFGVSCNNKINWVRKIEWYFEHFCEILESTGDERILGKCENYP